MFWCDQSQLRVDFGSLFGAAAFAVVSLSAGLGSREARHSWELGVKGPLVEEKQLAKDQQTRQVILYVQKVWKMVEFGELW